MHPQACSRSRQLFTRRRQPQQLFQSLPTHPLGLALGQRLDNLCLTSTEAEASPRGTEKHLGPQPLEGKLVPQQIAGRTSHPGVPQAHYTSTACIQQTPRVQLQGTQFSAALSGCIQHGTPITTALL